MQHLYTTASTVQLWGSVWVRGNDEWAPIQKHTYLQTVRHTRVVWILCASSCPDDQPLATQTQQDSFIQVSRLCALTSPTTSLLKCPQINGHLNKAMQLGTFVWGIHTGVAWQVLVFYTPAAEDHLIMKRGLCVLFMRCFLCMCMHVSVGTC